MCIAGGGGNGNGETRFFFFFFCHICASYVFPATGPKRALGNPQNKNELKVMVKYM